jgi:hypothetical protein
VAKSNEAHWKMSRLFANRQVTNNIAPLFTECRIRPEGLIDAPLRRCQHNRQMFMVDDGGRPARSRYTVLKNFRYYGLTCGRARDRPTHQLGYTCNPSSSGDWAMWSMRRSPQRSFSKCQRRFAAKKRASRLTRTMYMPIY